VELVFVPPRFEVYRAVSEQIRRIFADYTPLVEPLSLDEAYLDVTENLRGIPTASATAKDIRARILTETGLTASAGISYNTREQLHEVSVSLVQSVYPVTMGIRLVGVSLSKFGTGSVPEQLELGLFRARG
jgi:hypothetical protein